MCDLLPIIVPEDRLVRRYLHEHPMNPEPRDHRPSHPLQPKKASLLQTVWVVLSGLIMIGRSRDFAPSAPKLDPILLVIVALVSAALLIAGLVMLASFVAR